MPFVSSKDQETFPLPWIETSLSEMPFRVGRWTNISIGPVKSDRCGVTEIEAPESQTTVCLLGTLAIMVRNQDGAYSRSLVRSVGLVGACKATLHVMMGEVVGAWKPSGRKYCCFSVDRGRCILNLTPS